VIPSATSVEAAEWPTYALSPEEMDVVDLVLRGAVAPRPIDLPRELSAGTTVALVDVEGVIVAGLTLESAGPRGWTGRWTVVSGIQDEISDLRLSPAEIRAWAGDRTVAVVLWPGALSPHGLQEVVGAVAASECLVLLATLGQHDATDPAWHLRAAASRRTAELLAEALGEDRVRLVAVPHPGSDELVGELLRSYGARQIPLSEDATVPAPGVIRPSAGLVVFFTGLSGSGKSTIARALVSQILELTLRPVTLLDGDTVRRHLSSELGFSREHRDLNIQRIGFVCAEVSRHGGVAVACAIAPYAASRHRARELVASAGGRFLLVHVATPLAVCESRDRKGLYALARAGRITQFTGVSDPYEVPDDAELVIDATHGTPRAAARLIMDAAGLAPPHRRDRGAGSDRDEHQGGAEQAGDEQHEPGPRR